MSYLQLPDVKERALKALPTLTGDEYNRLAAINPRRWTDDDLGLLQLRLNAAGLRIVADAIGSLMFDKIELRRELDKAR